jgi:hypothetical protein
LAPRCSSVGCRLIAKAIEVDPAVCRLRAQATIPILVQALTWNGYWRHSREPIIVYDPSYKLERSFPIAFHLFDGDAGY